MKLTRSIRKAIGDEAADDFEILFSENLLTRPVFEERMQKIDERFQQVNERFQQVNERFFCLEGKIEQKNAALREDFLKAINDSKFTILKWVITLWVGQVLFFIGICFAFLR